MPFGDYQIMSCFFPISAVMPPPIDQPVLRLAVIPMSKNDAQGLPQSLREEINTEMESATYNLKHFFPHLEIVERTRIDVAIKELEFQGSGLVRDDNFIGVGRMLGADHVLIYQVTANSDADIKYIQRRGGFLRGIASGKLIRVQTGTAVFQQAAQQQSFVRPSDIGTEWVVAGIEGLKRATALLALNGLVQSLAEALMPSPTGILWDAERGGNRVKVLEVLSYSPADNAGIQRGDFIIAIDGIPVRGMGDRVLQDLEMTPRELVHITIQRNGREQTLALRPLKRNSLEKSSSPTKP